LPVSLSVSSMGKTLSIAIDLLLLKKLCVGTD
jgi:hypothetical protein